MAMASSIWRRRTMIAPPSRFCWVRARAALGRRPTSARALVQAQSRWAISMAMAISIWRWRTLGFISVVWILLGTGTGSFGAKTDFGTGVLPVSVAVGDFNGDGKLDLAVANLGSIFVNDPGPATVSILLNTGPTGPCASTNPIDCADFFVRQHYRDFLSRQADDLGLAFWTNEI